MSNIDFKATRKQLSCEHLINAKAANVFPLLCPVREFDWIEKWDCELIYSESGFAELGCIFSTFNPDDGGKDIWVISRYETDKRIQFVRVNSIRSITYDLFITEANEQTRILWQQQVTALNEKGNAFLETVNQVAFTNQIMMLQKLLNFYIETGKRMAME